MLQLVTLRSNDQFNTTVYGYDDRFRGVKGTRMVVFMNPPDIKRLGLKADEMVDLTTAIDDGRRARRPRASHRPLQHPARAAVGAYFPEANALVPLGHHDKQAHTPAYKATPVRVLRSEAAAA